MINSYVDHTDGLESKSSNALRFDDISHMTIGELSANRRGDWDGSTIEILLRKIGSTLSSSQILPSRRQTVSVMHSSFLESEKMDKILKEEVVVAPVVPNNPTVSQKK